MSSPTETHWLTLGAASRVLGINQATLRNWADQGRISVYRTLGGHRRFSSRDVEAITQSVEFPQAIDRGKDLGDRALRRIRRRLRGRLLEAERWHEQFDELSLSRMRLFGRRLLALATDVVSRRSRRPELVEEALFLGQDYAQEMVLQGLSLEDAIQAFSFFRNSMFDGLQSALGTSISSAEVYKTWQQVNFITDEVLKSMVGSFQRRSFQTSSTLPQVTGDEVGT